MTAEDDDADRTGADDVPPAAVTDDEPSAKPEFEEEFPSVTAGTDESASPSAGVGGGATGSLESEGSPVDPAQAADEASDGLGWQGWVLVGGLVVAMVLVPWAIVFLPEIQGALGTLGLGLRDAYLVLPMIPALALGALAVWAAVAYRRRQG